MTTVALQISVVALWILVVLHSVLLLGVVRIVYQLQQAGATAPKTSLAPGAAAPTFRTQDLSGMMIASSELTGRPAVLLFVSPGCPGCADALDDMPYLKKKANGTAIVICRSDRENCLHLSQTHELDVPVVADEDDRISREYGVVLVPTAVLIDSNGVIVSYGEPGQLDNKELHAEAPLAEVPA